MVSLGTIAKPTILIVDDNPENRDVFVQLLQFKGYHTVSAANGAQAVEIAERQRPDLILMDLSMPYVDGWEAIRRLKQRPSTAVIPILVLTAHALERERAEAFEAGCDDYVIKPADLLLLLDKTESLLRRSAQS